MRKKAFSNITRVLCILLAISLITGAASATDDGIQPLASDYLYSYTAYIADKGNGDLSVQFSVNGSGSMNQIGVSSITLQWSTNERNWYTCKTFDPEDYSQMLGSNRSRYASSVPYSGTEGRYYRASVTFYASDNYGSDSATIWTSSVQLKQS